MRMPILFLAIFLALGISTPGLAESRLTTVESPYSVAETVGRIEAILKQRGIGLAARIDHAAAARAAGLELPDTQVLLFGNPKLGTPLISANPEIAIELPMRLLVWQTSDGTVLIGYVPPSGLLQRYELAERNDAAQAMGGALAGIAKAAVAGN